MVKKRKARTAAAVDLSRFEGDRWKLPRCFVIHAWSPDYIRHVISAIRAALSKNFHVDVDLDFGSGESLREQALDAIQDAALIICILDDLRPNVLFELGYAKALGKPVLLMACEGAVVNVRDYYAKDAREGIENPLLDVDKHFSDVKDLLRCPYDSTDPEAPKARLVDELKNKVKGKSLGRRVLETWVVIMKERLAGEGDFQPLLDWILKTSDFDLEKPLFATRRRKTFNEYVEAGLHADARQEKPAELTNAVLEVIADLPPDTALRLARRLRERDENDIRLRFLECYAAVMVAKDAEFKDAEANKQAVGLHEQFLVDWPDSAEAHNNYALLLKELKRLAEAEKHYKAALKATPDLAEVHNNYANLLGELERFDEAEDHYKAALKAMPDDAEVHNNYGLLLDELERFDEAEGHYKAALKARPDDAQAHYNYANLLQKLERFAEAEKHYKAALKARPDDAEAHNNYASLLGELKRPKDAERHYKAAIKARPDSAVAHNNYALLLTELKRFDEAEDHYKAALKARPDYAEAHNNYAVLLGELKRFNEAEKHYKAALKARPDDAKVHYNYAVLLKELERFDEAEKHYKAALKARPDYAAAHNNYALLLKELKRFDEAEKHYKAALKARPDLAEAWANLGRLYQGTRRLEEARRCYRRALDLGTLPGGGERVRLWLSELDAPGSAGDDTPPNA